MFVLTIDNKAYTVDFKHHTLGTTCFIFEGSTSRGIAYAMGESIRNLKDNPCKAIGRKLSFSRALVAFDKPTRTLFWNEYHKKSRGTK